MKIVSVRVGGKSFRVKPSGAAQHLNPMAERQYIISTVLSPALLKNVGPLIPGALRHPERTGDDRGVAGSFLLDTGAFGCMIDLEVANSLGLAVRGAREIHGIHGYGTLQRYEAKIILPAENLSGEASTFSTIMDCLGIPSLVEKNQEHDVAVIGILGRMFLQFASLEIDGRAGKLTLRIDDATG